MRSHFTLLEISDSPATDQSKYELINNSCTSKQPQILRPSIFLFKMLKTEDKWKHFENNTKEYFLFCPNSKMEAFSHPEAWRNSREAYVHSTRN
jgi:phosphatidylinositol kinase/protein kinase (PI-3  family)